MTHPCVRVLGHTHTCIGVHTSTRVWHQGGDVGHSLLYYHPYCYLYYHPYCYLYYHPYYHPYCYRYCYLYCDLV